MPKDFLKGALDFYDVIVIGSGLAGMTGANFLAKQGHSVLLLEHHYQLGGLATWFTRKRGHIFDISLHGFPVGMIKSCRRYWTPTIANRIRQLRNIRFVNPQFDIHTTFDKNDFVRILTEVFGVAKRTVEAFFEELRSMNFYDRDQRTTRELFESYFPGRSDVQRLLLEPIAYANGSTLDDPAITYGIVFSNFMSKGVYIFEGGTDTLVKEMAGELQSNGVEIRKRCLAEEILTETVDGEARVRGVRVNGREIGCRAVLSNANLRNTCLELLDEKILPAAFSRRAKSVRVNSSSCQVYIGIREGETIPEIGDLVFTSDAETFSSDELLDFKTTSRTYSVYYPDTRPHRDSERYAIVASLNARYADWAELSEEAYQRHKERLCEEALAGLERWIPDIRQKVDWLEAATPRTINRYTRHSLGTSFGTKFEGLGVSQELPELVPGLYHAGSVGIIMSGWLGAINYGVITAGRIDRFLDQPATEAETPREAVMAESAQQ
ncbi:MAG: phytoene desaturase family protein [Opitutales bacterium]